MKNLKFIFILLLPSVGLALPDEEKQRTCTELSRPVLAVQRPVALSRCLEFASNDCDRMERAMNETCIETSHSDKAIAYDLSRGTASACRAALMKRDTQKIFCDGLNKECRETKIPLGGGGAQASCASFRDEDGKRLCAEIDRQAQRVIALEAAEKKKCADLKSN